MVPNLVTGVWVGNEDRSARFQSITYGQGHSHPFGLTYKLVMLMKILKVSRRV
jgi:penicillin-binding protein 1A